MLVKELHGYSNSKVLLLKENNTLFVRKFDNIQRNLERYDSLDLPFPKILNRCNEYYDIEYIENIDTVNYLLHNGPVELLDFITNVVDTLASKNTGTKDYSNVFYEKTKFISEYKELKFTQDELLKRLESNVLCTNYFGDLSLDNILFDTKKKEFVLIDGLTSVYDSYVFDLAKLSQDIKHKWFIRNKTIYINHQLNYLDKALTKKYPKYSNPYYSILMLLRILPYHKTEKDKNFILKRVNELWS